MTQQEFIEQVAKYGQKYYKQFGYKIVSPMIAQACLESSYGTSKKAIIGNNLLGLKYRPNRIKSNNGYFKDGGSEQNINGQYTQLPFDTAWYKFDTYEDCIKGYYEFLNIPNYAKVRDAKTPLEYLQEIKKAGYATSLNYIDNVYAVIQKWNLTKYDNYEISQLTTTPINIIKRTNLHNTTKINNRKIEWIVLHYTAGISSSQGAAQNTANYFSSTPNQASADFIVDDVEIVQYNPDPLNNYCWAVGGQLYSNKVNSLAGTMYGKCKNSNSISIEMCSRKKNTNSLAVTDNDWYITEDTINNTIKLTKFLMKEYNIDSTHVIMHNQVTGKWCPQPWTKNETALNHWFNFLKKLAGSTTTSNIIANNNPQDIVILDGKETNYKVKITTNILNVRSGPGTMYSITAQTKKDEIYTIIAEQDGWGLLKSKQGWISLDYVKNLDASFDGSPTPAQYLIKVTADSLNVRKGPSTTYPIVTQVRKSSIYTIIEEKEGWGKLKSGIGWLSLKYTEKV